MAHKIIYRVKVKQANGEKIPRVVEATHKGQAIRHAAKDTIEATVMSAKEVLDWIRSGGTVEVAAEEFETVVTKKVNVTPEQLAELSRIPGVQITADVPQYDTDGKGCPPAGGLPAGDR